MFGFYDAKPLVIEFALLTSRKKTTFVLKKNTEIHYFILVPIQKQIIPF
jgi:hypothetical protein